MKKTLIAMGLSLVISTLNSVEAHAVKRADTLADYWEIKSAHFEELAEIPSPRRTQPPSSFQPNSFLGSTSLGLGDILLDPASTVSGVDIALDHLINIGKKIWDIVVANKAVVNIGTDRAYVLPQGVSTWLQMQDWKTPSSRLFHVYYTNFLGMKVVDFNFRLIYTYGGSVGGKGQYLTQIGVNPSELMVKSGYTFNSEVSVPSITNAGTSESPIGAAEILVHWTMENYARHVEGTRSFYIRGDGYFEDLSGKDIENTGNEKSSTSTEDEYGFPSWTDTDG